MTEQDFKEKMLAIEHRYNEEKKYLYMEYAFHQRAYKVGDIIKKYDTIILVEKYGTHVFRDISKPSYIGKELRKDLVPKKNGAIGRINGNEAVELIKSFCENQK